MIIPAPRTNPRDRGVLHSSANFPLTGRYGDSGGGGGTFNMLNGDIRAAAADAVGGESPSDFRSRAVCPCGTARISRWARRSVS
jgi:hypothetical protein